MKYLVLLLTCLPAARASEMKCLSETMYAEARGESLQGLIAVGQASVQRALKTNTSICKIAAARKKIPQDMRRIYELIAAEVLNKKIPPQIGQADSWNTGRRPAYKGDAVTKIGHHVFYKMAGL